MNFVFKMLVFPTLMCGIQCNRQQNENLQCSKHIHNFHGDHTTFFLFTRKTRLFVPRKEAKWMFNFIIAVNDAECARGAKLKSFPGFLFFFLYI